jgi:predicted secreted protein
LDDVSFTYYRGTSPEPDMRLASAPKDAGEYCVVVTTPATSTCQQASCTSSFTILPRPAALSISATPTAGEGATVSVTMTGALEDVRGKPVQIEVDATPALTGASAGDEPAQDEAYANDTPALVAQASSVQASIAATGDFVASHDFANVGAGEYQVTASFADPNYVVSPAVAHFDKRMRHYRVVAQDVTVSYGAQPFDVQAQVWDDIDPASPSLVSDPTFGYAQVTSQSMPMLSDDAAVLRATNAPTVDVRNAGVSAVRMEVAGDNVHEGGFDYAIITVERAPLVLSVAAANKETDGKPTDVDVQVGDDGQHEYPSPYTGEVALSYFREEGGVRTQLDAAPIWAGSYVVVATAPTDRNYEGTVAEAAFTITGEEEPDDPDTPDDPVTPDNPDGPDNPDDPNGPNNPDHPVTPEAPDTPPSTDDPSAPVTPNSPTGPMPSGSSSSSGVRPTGTSMAKPGALPDTGDDAPLQLVAMLALWILVLGMHGALGQTRQI